MTTQYGKTDWNQSSGKVNNYLKLLNGKNLVRLLTAPYVFMIHKVKFDGDDNNYGRTIKCALTDCPLCAKDNPAKKRYIVALITRKTGELKYLEFGELLYNKIKDITENMDGFGDPMSYELNIARNPSGGATNFYAAFPVGVPKPLSAEDIALAETIDEAYLDKLVAPPSAEEVKESMKRITSWIAKKNNTAEAPAQEETETEENNSETDDGDFTFKKNVR